MTFRGSPTRTVGFACLSRPTNRRRRPALERDGQRRRARSGTRRAGAAARARAGIVGPWVQGALDRDPPGERDRPPVWMARVVSPLRELAERECLGLLASRVIGRAAVVVEGEARVFPVNYLLDGRAIVFRTDEGTK